MPFFRAIEVVACLERGRQLEHHRDPPGPGRGKTLQRALEMSGGPVVAAQFLEGFRQGQVKGGFRIAPPHGRLQMPHGQLEPLPLELDPSAQVVYVGKIGRNIGNRIAGLLRVLEHAGLEKPVRVGEAPFRFARSEDAAEQVHQHRYDVSWRLGSRPVSALKP